MFLFCHRNGPSLAISILFIGKSTIDPSFVEQTGPCEFGLWDTGCSHDVLRAGGLCCFMLPRLS